MITAENELSAVQAFYAAMPAIPVPEGQDWLKLGDRRTVPLVIEALRNEGLQLLLIDNSIPHLRGGTFTTYDKIRLAAVGSLDTVQRLCRDLSDAVVSETAPLGMEQYRAPWPQTLWEANLQYPDGSWFVHQLRRYQLTDNTPIWQPILARSSDVELTFLANEEYANARKL